MKSWLPAALTHMAHNVDGLFYSVLGVVTFFFVLVEVLLITFLIKYRRTKKNRVGAPIHGSNKLEVLWTLIPAVILVAIGVASVRYVYAAQLAPPANNTVVIKVIGHEWHWEFKYPNGVDTTNDLRVPAGENVLFDITSADVVHGFYIPAVRMQQDALPGRQTQFWMNIEDQYVGHKYLVPCDQFCGAGHPTMVASMTVMSQANFQNWLQTEKQKQNNNSSN